MGAGASARAPLSFEAPNASLLEEYELVETKVERGETSWENLEADEQKIMDAVVATLRAAAHFNPMKEGDARGGDEDAMYHMSVLLAEGHGVAKDEEQAVYILKEGSLRGHMMCKYMLADMYFEDRGVPSNNAPYFNQFRAVKLWKDVADQHLFVPAYLRLAEAYKTGVGVMKPDPVIAGEYYTKATNSHVADAYSELAEMYEKGSGGFEKDESRAAEQYKFSVDQGNNKAKYQLSNMYMDGRGVPQDKNKGDELFKEAVAKGNENAQYHQAILLARRKGSDVFKAIGLLTHAARRGHPKARLQLQRIKSGEQIEDNEIAGAKKSAMKFQRSIASIMLGAGKKAEPIAEAEPDGAPPPAASAAPAADSAKYDWEGKPVGPNQSEQRKPKGAEPWSPFTPMSATMSSLAKSASSAVSALAKKVPVRRYSRKQNKNEA